MSSLLLPGGSPCHRYSGYCGKTGICHGVDTHDYVKAIGSVFQHVVIVSHHTAYDPVSTTITKTQNQKRLGVKVIFRGKSVSAMKLVDDQKLRVNQEVNDA